MDADQLIKQLNAAGVVVIVNNLNVTINNVYQPMPLQIDQGQVHRWVGYSYPYEICECGVMTRNLAGHIAHQAQSR